MKDIMVDILADSINLLVGACILQCLGDIEYLVKIEDISYKLDKIRKHHNPRKFRILQIKRSCRCER